MRERSFLIGGPPNLQNVALTDDVAPVPRDVVPLCRDVVPLILDLVRPLQEQGVRYFNLQRHCRSVHRRNNQWNRSTVLSVVSLRSESQCL
jgi:hypothetical protein